LTWPFNAIERHSKHEIYKATAGLTWYTVEKTFKKKIFKKEKNLVSKISTHLNSKKSIVQ
jgi:hypothetical protein